MKNLAPTLNKYLIVVVLLAICLGVLVFYKHVTQKEENMYPIEESELIMAQVNYSGLVGRGSLVSVFQDKSVYYVEFEANRRIENERITYVENSINNLSLFTIEQLFSLSKCSILTNTDRTYTIYVGDRSVLSIVEFENLFETINSSGFLAFNDEYVENDLLDGIDTFLTVSTNDDTKTVHEYGHCAPNGFHQISEVIQNIIASRWR